MSKCTCPEDWQGMDHTASFGGIEIIANEAMPEGTVEFHHADLITNVRRPATAIAYQLALATVGKLAP